ncbi:MAG TPA: hypothetical protein VGO33_01805 [Gemmatimonadaceae bacterium]|nr:hypothetical protein [Gemmatimonadaceae bacterium]
MKKLHAYVVWAISFPAALSVAQRPASAQTYTVQPVLAFPETGLDDPAAYQGYQTRFFRDTRGNVVQIYLDARRGRVVNLLADAVDESVGFTVRDRAGKPLQLDWGSPDAVISQSGTRRTIEYQLVANASQVVIGWILLGSMRVERDLGYSGREPDPFEWPTFHLREEEDLIANLEKLPPAERDAQLHLLNAGYVEDLRARLVPDVLTTGVRDRRGVTITQATLDGKTNLQFDLAVEPKDVSVLVTVPTITLTSTTNRPVRFTVRVTTDGPPLTPLARDQIFNAPFLRFLSDARTAADRATRGNARTSPSAAATVSRYRQLERDVRGTELLSSREKLMAGLPNYATYFGRDMMMTSLMMEPVWTDAMSEFVIASALRKLGPAGDVSHEEALGGQAIRENAAEYNAHMAEYFRLVRRASRAAADTALANARALLGDLQKVRENYHMRDDEFQLPVVAARYLTNPAVSTARKRAFLLDTSDGQGPRLGLLMRELGLVATLAAPYGRDPVIQNLIASPRLDSTHWRSISWRDSNAGYANGRFAMDINAIWAPRALQAIGEILGALGSIGFSNDQIAGYVPRTGGAQLAEFVGDPVSLPHVMQNWRGASRHFVVTIPAAEIRGKVQQKLQWLPAEEHTFWQGVLTRTAADTLPLEFLAISLDSAGKPIPVVNTDPATSLLLRDAKDTSPDAIAAVRRDVSAISRPYPVGLFIDRLGPVVANDAYASPSVWEAFRKDTYHSPRVVWGREVNLILLGLANQISGATDADGGPASETLAPYVSEMRDAVRRVNDAVESSGLKHNELWSYEISGGQLKPIRYGASTDVQLWNVTDLAVQFVLQKLGVY